MDIDIFPAHELATVLRVLRSVLEHGAALDEPAQAFLRTYARITGFDPSREPAAIEPDEVRIADPLRALRLVQLAAMAALLRRPPRAEAVDYVDRLARRLGVRHYVVGVLHALLKGHRRRVRAMVLSRGMRSFIREAYEWGGTVAALRYVGAMAFRMAGSRDRLADYKRLGLLPEGTVGREYWKLMTLQGFAFPGEHGGIPPSIAYHDVSHVIAGHGNDPAGEIQQACFQAGNRRHEDSFFFALFSILHFHQGVKITPVADAEVGYFDPEKVLWAIHRGARCGVDMTHQWDFWPLLPLPVEEARRRCGLLPAP